MVMKTACALLLLAMALPVHGQQTRTRIDVERLGPQVGQRVPDFRLQDHGGKPWSRDALMGPNGLMLRLGAEGRPAEAQRITTDHLEVTTYTTDDVVAPGSLFSIVFDIRPRERMHVYAPGAKDYRIISFNLEANPMLVTRPVQYPASDIYFFEPLNERVPVFQKPFRLTQSVAVSPSPGNRAALVGVEAITIKGTLDYQACDDRICFTPKSIRVSYSVKVRQLDTERANVPR